VRETSPLFHASSLKCPFPQMFVSLNVKRNATTTTYRARMIIYVIIYYIYDMSVNDKWKWTPKFHFSNSFPGVFHTAYSTKSLKWYPAGLTRLHTNFAKCRFVEVAWKWWKRSDSVSSNRNLQVFHFEFIPDSLTYNSLSSTYYYFVSSDQ
jgi:hypothetical protein